MSLTLSTGPRPLVSLIALPTLKKKTSCVSSTSAAPITLHEMRVIMTRLLAPSLLSVTDMPLMLVCVTSSSSSATIHGPRRTPLSICSRVVS